MQVDPGPPTRQSRTSINYLLSPEQPSTVKFRSQTQRSQPSSQDSKPVKIPFQTIRCTNCEELINTTDGDGNPTGLWEMHSRKCSRASPTPSDASSVSLIEDTTPFRRHKVRLGEEERLMFLRKDKQIVEIEEYQVLCAFCDTWIHLRKDRPYCSIAWSEHKLTCRRKRPSPKPLSTSKRPKREHTASSVVPAQPPDNTFTPSSSVVPNLGPPGLVVNRGTIPPPTLPPSSSSLVSTSPVTLSTRSHHPRRSDPGPGGLNLSESSPYLITSPPQIRRTESERVKLLVSDPNATTVEPHRVLCGVCGRWIQLRKNSTYCTAPWIQHVSKCVKRNGQTSARSNVQRNSTSMIQIPPRQATPSISRASAEQHQPAEREELESDGDLEADDLPHSSSRRPRGRPRKRRHQNGHTSILGRRSISPIPPPSPPPNHPYPAVPPVSTLSSHYAHSQYSTTDDSYAMYFDVEAMPPSLLSQMTSLPPFPPGEGKRWIVYQLQNYEKNGCPVKSVVTTTPSSGGGTTRVEDGDDEIMERKLVSTQPPELKDNNVTAGDRVNDAVVASDPSSLKTRNWSHSTASIEESNNTPYQQRQGEAVHRSTSRTPGKGSFHGEQQENNGVSQIRSRTPHRPVVPTYESPRLPREPYRSPHMDVLSPEPKPQPNLPPSPSPPLSALIQPTPIARSPAPRRPRYFWDSDDDSTSFRKTTTTTTAGPISNSPPPAPPPLPLPLPPPPAALPPLPQQQHRPIIQTNYSGSSTSTSPTVPYRTAPQQQSQPSRSQSQQPPIRLPPIPNLPSGPYAMPDPYHSSPVPQHTGGLISHSPRHSVSLVNNGIYRSPPPPPPPLRTSPPPPPPPPSLPRRYDTPGSSSNHVRHSVTAGMKNRSPAREDRRSSFPNKKRSRQSRSRSPPKSLIPPPRPVPTYMARISPEARLFYTHKCIAYLFQTTLKGAIDIPLKTLMGFMNDGFDPQISRTICYTFEEVRDCVAELGRRKMLIFTQEGGVQFGEAAMDFD